MSDGGDRNYILLASAVKHLRTENGSDYLLLAFFAAQIALSLADNFALVAALIDFFLDGTERAADLLRLIFAHLAFCVAAIFFFTELLIVRLFFLDAALPCVLSIRLSSLLRESI